MFTRTHYKAIAKVFNESFMELFKDVDDPDLEVPVAINILRAFLVMFKKDNEAFNEEGFMKVMLINLPKDDIEFWFSRYS